MKSQYLLRYVLTLVLISVSSIYFCNIEYTVVVDNGVNENEDTIVFLEVVDNGVNENKDTIVFLESSSSTHPVQEIHHPDVKVVQKVANVSLSYNATPSSRCTKYKSYHSDCARTLRSNSLGHKHDIDWEVSNNTSFDEEAGCKTLWFSGIYEGRKGFCRKKKTAHLFNSDYSVALNSAMHYAKDVLQPVTVLGRYGTSRVNKTSPTKFGRWAESKGSKLIHTRRISFQDDLMKAGIDYVIMSAFMRLDIPLMIKQHKLFDIPGVCQKYVFYTDADVIFANPLSKGDIDALKSRLANSDDAILSYGRESSMKPSSINTGVMMIDVERFEKELPKILDHARKAKKFPSHDQEMLNLYFFGQLTGGIPNKKNERSKKVDLLPIGYNWKPYWGLDKEEDFEKIKIIHTHGPKSNRGLEEMADCDFQGVQNKRKGSELGWVPDPYHPLINHGICYGHGVMGKWTIEAIKNFEEPYNNMCKIE